MIGPVLCLIGALLGALALLLRLSGCDERNCNDSMNLGELFTSPNGNIYTCQNTGEWSHPKWQWVLLEAAVAKPDAGVQAEVKVAP